MADAITPTAAPSIRLEDEAACQRLCVAFANHLDARRYDEVLDLFTDDGMLDRTGTVFSGRAALQQFLLARAPDVATRHLCTNMQVSMETADEASGFCYVLFFQSRGAAGAAASGPPGVVEYSDRFRRTPAGWRIQQRRIRLAMPG